MKSMKSDNSYQEALEKNLREVDSKENNKKMQRFTYATLVVVARFVLFLVVGAATVLLPRFLPTVVATTVHPPLRLQR